MSKRVSSTAIGIFVVGSLGLLVLALVILGSGRLFRQPHQFVCFFQGSLNGLKVGAPVKFRGVEIGTVQKIMLRLPPSYGTVNPQLPHELPVIVDIDEAQLKRQGGTGAALKEQEVDSLVKQGLRAQLNMESLLTGVLFIDLDFHPGTPATFLLEPGARIREIPTIPTDLAQVQKSAMTALSHLEDVNFGALATSMTNAANAMQQLANSPDLRDTLASLKESAAGLNATLASVRHLSTDLDAKLDPAIESLKLTSDQANLTLAQMTSTMATLKMSVAPDSPLMYRLNQTLANLSKASNSVNQLADYLQRNPSALVRGRYISDRKSNDQTRP